MEKVKLTKEQAKSLEKQIRGAAEWLGTSDHDEISRYLIGGAWEEQLSASRYEELPRPCRSLVEEIGIIQYVDALRKGYFVELTLEERYLDIFQKRMDTYAERMSQILEEKPELLDRDTLDRLKYLEGQKVEAYGCIYLFKKYLEARRSKEEESK
ncbi:hypothetical protein [Bacillus phage BM-P1]|nr:hypothetical protein [Bacillus phage BM-P1]